MTNGAMMAGRQVHSDLFVSGERSAPGTCAANLLPGDKSISHRVMLLAALTPGLTRIRGLNTGIAVQELVPALRALGVRVDRDGMTTVIEPPPAGLRSPREVLQLGSSSAAARLLIGVLAGLGLPAEIDGDDSLRARPMEWVVEPLVQLGASIRYLSKTGHLPIAVDRATLRDGSVCMAVGSAQASSAVMLASVAAGIQVHIAMRARSRDHTVRLLRALGVEVEDTKDGVLIRPRSFAALDEYVVPTDPSAVAYPVAGHVFQAHNSEMRFTGVCVNPTRIGFFDLLCECGVAVRYENVRESWGEPVGDIVVDSANTQLRPFCIADADRVHSLIDEVPLAMALGAMLPGISEIRGAAELGFKETNRLVTTKQMLCSFGAHAEIGADHIQVLGKQPLHPGTVACYGDHRIAMTAATLGCALDGRSRLMGGACYETSFPDFPAVMTTLGFHISNQA